MLGYISICICAYLLVLFTLKEVSIFISTVVLKSEITCSYTHFAELSLVWICLWFAFVFMESCLGKTLHFSWRVLGEEWNFCVCSPNKIWWSTYHKLPILFYIYILHHTLLVCETCTMYEILISSLTGPTTVFGAGDGNRSWHLNFSVKLDLQCCRVR